MYRRALFVLVILCQPLSAQLSRTERHIADAVDAGRPAALALLERAVNINSGTQNFVGVRAVGDLFAAEYQRLGFTTRWIEGAAFHRAGHLVAEWRGNGQGPRVLLIGHLDTVFEEDSPFQRWVRVNDSTAHGPGAMDMKGGDVIMLLMLKALRQAGVLDHLQVTVMLMGDEEDTGNPAALARADLVAAADSADIAIGFEDGDGDLRTAVVGRRGWTSWTLATTGQAAHSSQIFKPEVGSGAIYEAARILSAWHDSLAGEPNLTFNPGVIVGGTRITYDDQETRGSAFGKPNVVADSVVTTGDLRTLTLGQRDSAVERMQRIAARHYPRTDATVTFAHSSPPFAPTEGNRRLLAMVDQASRDLGYGPVGPVDPANAGGADISHVAGRVEMALDGVGMMGTGGHTVNETADLRALTIQAKRVGVVLSRLAR